MPYPFPPDLQTLVGEQMASGKYASEDELLRSALRALAEEEQDLDAVRESLARQTGHGRHDLTSINDASDSPVNEG
jgi:putative addiction module CopG family antidote